VERLAAGAGRLPARTVLRRWAMTTRLIVCWTAWMAAASPASLLIACNGSNAGPSPSDAGGDSTLPDAAPNISDASTDAIPDGMTQHEASLDGEAPLTHRSAGNACPQVRAAINAVSACDEAGCPSGMCTIDTDCTAGDNGRCGDSGGCGPAATLGCSYDQCFADSECEGGPCLCRPSSSSSAANQCFAGNCKVDSDCGHDGYCSPSLPCYGCGGYCPSYTGPCPADSGDECSAGPCICSTGPNLCPTLGYYCHTPDDSCVNDSDCAGGTQCLYNVVKQAWACLGAECPV